MKNDYFKILSSMQQLDLEIEKPELLKSTRIFIQKFTYILKKLGFKFTNYNDYNFYINGVYSPHLTQDYYQFSADFSSDISKFSSTHLNANELRTLKQYKKSVLNHPFFESNKIEFHEAITTLLYLKEQYPELSERELLERAKNLKNHLTSKILAVSLNLIKKLTFDSEMMALDIQEEFNLWDSLNDGD